MLVGVVRVMMSFALTNEDLFNFIMKDELMFRALAGIFPIDKLPKLTHPDKFYLINSDPAFLPGKHWICVFFPQDVYAEFFDSLGRQPFFYSNAITNFIGNKCVYNSMRLQPPNSSTCGLYCLYFLYHRVRGKSFLNILETFSNDLEHNDAIVIDFYRDYS